MKRTPLITLAAALVGIPFGLAATPAEGSKAPTVLEFSKCFSMAKTVENQTPTWTGSIDGGESIEVRLIEYRAPGEGSADHLTVDFIVQDGGQPFVARLTGIFNASTERTVLNGTVTSGWLEGARVHEQGLRVDAAQSCYEGSLRLMPASS